MFPFKRCPKKRVVIEIRSAKDFSRIKEEAGIELCLEFLEESDGLGAERALERLAPRKAEAIARCHNTLMRAKKLCHLIRKRAHALAVLSVAKIEDGTDLKAAPSCLAIDCGPDTVTRQKRLKLGAIRGKADEAERPRPPRMTRAAPQISASTPAPARRGASATELPSRSRQ